MFVEHNGLHCLVILDIGYTQRLNKCEKYIVFIMSYSPYVSNKLRPRYFNISPVWWPGVKIART